MSLSVANAATAFEYVLIAIGAYLAWRLVFSPAARSRRQPSPLPAWNAEPVEFLLFLASVMVGIFLIGVIVTSLLKATSLSGDLALVIGGGSAQIGMLVGIWFFANRSPGFRTRVPRDPRGIVLSGTATFLITLPFVWAASQSWEFLLRSVGFPTHRQDLVRIFVDAKSPVLVVLLIVLAVVTAPISEELLFRAGIFRYLRTRANRTLALLGPAILFAALHVGSKDLDGFDSFVPLIVVALVNSLAYERTGHIGTAIVAHALFNLNTIALILCGVGTTP